MKNSAINSPDYFNHRSALVRTLRRRIYTSLPSPRGIYLQQIAAMIDGKTLLDIGCGFHAPTLARLSEAGKMKVGIDLCQNLLKPRAAHTWILRADAMRLPFADATFDLIVSQSVLEHVLHPEVLLNEVYRTLRPGGYFLFLTPNRWDYVSLSASVIPNRYHGAIVNRLTGRAEQDTFDTLYRANSRRQIHKLAGASGLVVRSLSMLREHPHYLQFNGLAYLLGAVFELIVQRSCVAVRPWILGRLQRPPLN